MLAVRDLRAGYSGSDVIHDVHLDVQRGEIVAILGPNGGGKTTTLRALSGLISSRGSVRFNDHPLGGMPPSQRACLGLGHVPEGRRILGRLTVLENLRLGLAARNAATSWRGRLDEVLHIFPDLASRLQDPAAQLSGGQQQMLALGRALMAEPTLLAIDEMSFGLAPGVTRELLATVTRLRESGTTFLVVEQDVAILQICDRAYVMRGGRIIAEERPATLLADGTDRLGSLYLGRQRDRLAEANSAERKHP